MQTGVLASIPDAGQVREAAREVFSSGKYQLDADIPQNSLTAKWLAKFLDFFFSTVRAVADWLGALPSLMRWGVVIVLIAILVLLIVHSFRSLTRSYRRRTDHLDGNRLRGGDRRTALAFEQEAMQSATAGDWLNATRLLLRAAVTGLEQSQGRRFRESTTNRMYLRRYRTTTVQTDLKQLVETTERTWYGGQACLQSDYENCRVAYQSIARFAEACRPC